MRPEWYVFDNGPYEIHQYIYDFRGPNEFLVGQYYEDELGKGFIWYNAIDDTDGIAPTEDEAIRIIENADWESRVKE